MIRNNISKKHSICTSTCTYLFYYITRTYIYTCSHTHIVTISKHSTISLGLSPLRWHVTTISRDAAYQSPLMESRQTVGTHFEIQRLSLCRMVFEQRCLLEILRLFLWYQTCLTFTFYSDFNWIFDCKWSLLWLLCFCIFLYILFQHNYSDKL